MIAAKSQRRSLDIHDDVLRLAKTTAGAETNRRARNVSVTQVLLEWLLVGYHAEKKRRDEEFGLAREAFGDVSVLRAATRARRRS